MPISDDDALDERLERALPRLLVDQPYDFQQDLEDFRSEEALLDAEIDQIWEQVVEEVVPKVVAEKPKSKSWIGVVAASLVVGLGVTALINLGHSAQNANTLRSTQAPLGPENVLAQALQQRWKPKITVQATRNIILSAKVEPGNPNVEVHLIQSSGDAAVDQQTLKTAATLSVYESVSQPLPMTYTLDFDLRSGKVSVHQK